MITFDSDRHPQCEGVAVFLLGGFFDKNLYFLYENFRCVFVEYGDGEEKYIHR